MKPLQLTFLAVLAAFTLALTACGSGSDVPDGVVAVVDGTELTRKQLDELVEQAKNTYEAQGSEFPRVGTPEYQNVQKQYVAFLVQRAQFEHEAEERDLKITEKDIDKEVDKFVDSRFQGKRTEFEKALKEQGFTEKAFRDTIRTSVLSQKLFDAVTKEVEAPDAEITAYYQQNQQQYSRAESRDVRHILIAEKTADDKVDYAASKTKADQVRAELVSGGDFAALAKEHSQDPSSANTGGKYTAERGRSVPEFDKMAFELKLGVISEPVKTTFGYHLIEALSPIRKAETTSLAKVKASIKATLLQAKKTEFMTKWVEDTRDEYEGKTRYAIGFEPPELPDPTETDTETTATQ
jgi:parvulin-like peptidyl-prolyl isomerase